MRVTGMTRHACHHLRAAGVSGRTRSSGKLGRLPRRPFFDAGAEREGLHRCLGGFRRRARALDGIHQQARSTPR
jgi:hypothetical protein